MTFVPTQLFQNHAQISVRNVKTLQLYFQRVGVCQRKKKPVSFSHTMIIFSQLKSRWTIIDCSVQKANRNSLLDEDMKSHGNLPMSVEGKFHYSWDYAQQVFYDWKTYLQNFFKPLKNLTRYRHFQFHADNPGWIEVKERNSGNPVSVNVLKGNVQPTAGQLPDVITKRGLYIGRQWYLYENIREFCSSDAAKDAICLRPVLPKPEAIAITDKENSKPTNIKRKQSLLH